MCDLTNPDCGLDNADAWQADADDADMERRDRAWEMETQDACVAYWLSGEDMEGWKPPSIAIRWGA